LVVVDYYTNWCGPCKQIAPLFSELASAHKGKVVCVKVDGDRARDLVAAHGVQGFPTFHFYEKGSKIESFSGADSRRLRSIIEEHAAKADAPPPCPYRHFPLRDSEAAKYADIQWDKVEPKFREINGAADKMPADHPGKLSDAELAEVDALIATLKNKAAYHSSKVTAGQCAVVAKMLSLWPRDQLAAPLNLARIFVTHPSAAAQCAEASDKEVGGLSDVLTPLLRLASSVEKAVTALLAVRSLCNCFARRVLARALLRRLEKVCESAAAAFRRHAADENLRLSVCALYINAAILLSESQDAASVEQEKVLLISAAQEALTDEPPNPKVVYRCAVVIGTLAYNDPTATQLARDLEIGHALANTAKSAQCKDDQTVQQVAEEIQQLLKEK
jgi:thioredoxin 1